MDRKIITGVGGLVIGIVVGILMGIFLFPNLLGGIGIDESGYERITVFSDVVQSHDFGDYHYYFYYKYYAYSTIENPIVVEVRGEFEGIPAIAGTSHTVLDLRIVVSEVHDDYVVLSVKLS